MIVPILLKHALRERGENAYLDALCRVKSEALSIVENFDMSPPMGRNWGHEHILSRMGSAKFLDFYHTLLESNDTMMVRRAIALLANIGADRSKLFLEKLKSHSNYNISIEVSNALESWTSNF